MCFRLKDIEVENVSAHLQTNFFRPDLITKEARGLAMSDSEFDWRMIDGYNANVFIKFDLKKSSIAMPSKS